MDLGIDFVVALSRLRVFACHRSAPYRTVHGLFEWINALPSLEFRPPTGRLGLQLAIGAAVRGACQCARVRASLWAGAPGLRRRRRNRADPRRCPMQREKPLLPVSPRPSASPIKATPIKATPIKATPTG